MNRRTTSSAALSGGRLSMMMVCSAGYGGNLGLQWLVHENCYPLNAYDWSFDAGHRLRTQDTDDDATATVYIGPRPMMTTLRMNEPNAWEVFYDPGDAIAFGWRWEGIETTMVLWTGMSMMSTDRSSMRCTKR